MTRTTLSESPDLMEYDAYIVELVLHSVSVYNRSVHSVTKKMPVDCVPSKYKVGLATHQHLLDFVPGDEVAVYRTALPPSQASVKVGTPSVSSTFLRWISDTEVRVGINGKVYRVAYLSVNKLPTVNTLPTPMVTDPPTDRHPVPDTDEIEILEDTYDSGSDNEDQLTQAPIHPPMGPPPPPTTTTPRLHL